MRELIVSVMDAVCGLGLTGAAGLGERRRVAEVVLQRQVSHTVQTPVGGKAQRQRVAASERDHEPRRAAARAARAAGLVDRGRVGQGDQRRRLRGRVSRALLQRVMEAGTLLSPYLPCRWWRCTGWRTTPKAQP